jgi:hypothetical protein
MLGSAGATMTGAEAGGGAVGQTGHAGAGGQTGAGAGVHTGAEAGTDAGACPCGSVCANALVCAQATASVNAHARARERARPRRQNSESVVSCSFIIGCSVSRFGAINALLNALLHEKINCVHGSALSCVPSLNVTNVTIASTELREQNDLGVLASIWRIFFGDRHRVVDVAQAKKAQSQAAICR